MNGRARGHRPTPRAVCCAALVGGFAAFAEGGAASQPLPVFLPAHVTAVTAGEPTKKDPRVDPGPPAPRETLCTVFNLHTGEALVLGPAPTPGESSDVARLLRDRSTWEEHPIDPLCLVTLRAAVTRFGARRVEVISGYRSDKLNEHLRKKGHHVARQSQHVLGRAVDFRLAGVPTAALLRFARETHPGGIGFYPRSGFLHVDAGPRRQWSGE